MENIDSVCSNVQSARQWSCDQDDHKRKKSHNETRLQNPLGCSARFCSRWAPWFALVFMWTTYWRWVPVNWQRICCRNSRKTLQCVRSRKTLQCVRVTNKPREFLGRSLCRTPKGYTFGVSSHHVTKLWKDFGFGELKGSDTLSFEKLDDHDTVLDESGRRRHNRPDIKNAVCQLPTHVGTATTHDDENIKRLLRYCLEYLHASWSLVAFLMFLVLRVLRKVWWW